MKRVLTGFIGVSMLAGCQASPAFVRGVDALWTPIRGEYVGYVSADANLDQTGKQIRLESVKAMDELLAAEKARSRP